MTTPASVTLPFPFPTVAYHDATVVLIDQTVLPGKLAWRECRDIPALATAIRELAVRGAPAIGIAAAYGLVMSWERAADRLRSSGAVLDQFLADRAVLAATRPTAVNLFWALERLGGVAEAAVAAGEQPERILAALRREADRVLADDLETCRAMGRAGAELLPDPATVLTHCNAGGLATGGYGTALGVVYAAREAGKTVRVYADETRPLLQGARLTAWEMVSRGIEVTVICEGAAATVLRDGRIDAVITGADRVAANGDAANKIGTYPLAVLAREHGVPFYVAAPASTFDPATPAGDGIEVEVRGEDEVLGYGDTRWGAPGARAYNPAFDVTPAMLITAFFTELGVIRPPYGTNLRPVLEASRQGGGLPG